jgi:hypothetical protein
MAIIAPIVNMFLLLCELLQSTTFITLHPPLANPICSIWNIPYPLFKKITSRIITYITQQHNLKWYALP